MSEQKTHWKKLVNPLYIGAYSLNPGEDLLVRITHVGREVVTSTGGKKEECTVAHLENNKPMILNATNSKTIAKLYGSYIEDWCGKCVMLFASTTMLAGEKVECLRIRPTIPTTQIKQKQLITDERLDKALASIKAGDFTYEKLEAGFDLTGAQIDKVDMHKELPA